MLTIGLLLMVEFIYLFAESLHCLSNYGDSRRFGYNDNNQLMMFKINTNS